MSEAIRIFVGCSPNNEDLESQSVLEHSLRKHATMHLELTWMQLSRDASSFWYSDPKRGLGWNTATWATPFSPFRWGIPAACNYEGKAIYLDSDMICSADITELWTQEFKPGASIISKGIDERYCVMLMDCARMKKYLPPIDRLKSDPGAYRTLRRSIAKYVQRFKGNWNCVDGESYKSLNDPDIKLIHYSSIPHQVHLKHSLPRLIAEGGKHWFTGQAVEHWRADLQDLFDTLLTEAIENGYPPERYRKEPFGDYKIRWAA